MVSIQILKSNQSVMNVMRREIFFSGNNFKHRTCKIIVYTLRYTFTRKIIVFHEFTIREKFLRIEVQFHDKKLIKY